MSLKERERKRDRDDDRAMTDRQNGKSKMTWRKREGRKGEEKRLNLFAKKNEARKKMKKRWRDATKKLGKLWHIYITRMYNLFILKIDRDSIHDLFLNKKSLRQIMWVTKTHWISFNYSYSRLSLAIPGGFYLSREKFKRILQRTCRILSNKFYSFRNISYSDFSLDVNENASLYWDIRHRMWV